MEKTNSQGQETPENVLQSAIMADCNVNAPLAGDEQTEKILRVLSDCMVKADEQVEKTDYLFSWCGVDFMPRQNVVSLKAPAKTGKTFALTAFATAFVKGEYQGLRCYADSRERLLFVDTEQARNSTRKVFQRIIANAPGAAQVVDVMNVRNVASSERLTLIKTAVEMYGPALIVIDGIADLIPGMDYNDLSQADAVISEFATIAESYNAVVLTAIHTNKNDNNATGWLGKILLQKCALEMSMSRKQGEAVRKIEFTAARDREIEPISVTIEDTENGYGRIRIIAPDEGKRITAEATKRHYKDTLISAGITPMQGTKSDFVDAYQEGRTKADGTEYNRRTASQHINRCIEVGALTEVGDEYQFEA